MKRGDALEAHKPRIRPESAAIEKRVGKCRGEHRSRETVDELVKESVIGGAIHCVRLPLVAFVRVLNGRKIE
jgi:hypothetical protein